MLGEQVGLSGSYIIGDALASHTLKETEQVSDPASESESYTDILSSFSTEQSATSPVCICIGFDIAMHA